jgi:membrane-bound lytic murein transglycosylase C
MRKLMTTCLAVTLVFLLSSAMGQDETFDKAARRQQQEWEALRQEGEDLFRGGEDEWNRMLREQQKAWDRMVEEINRIWLDGLATTKKEWVDYSDQYTTRSYVNFENGDLVLATMIKTSETRISELSKKRIGRQLVKVLSPNKQSGQAILAGQITDSHGEPVTVSTLNRYLNKEVFPRLQKDPQPILGKDGVPRHKISVPIKLIPDHTMVRAQPYIPEVRRQSRRFGLRPELLMAVIHTESYFDPLARSHVPAYGLMQLVPKYGAREAYQFVYRRDRLLPASYLYVPTNNVELGSGYLHLLIHKYFSDEANPLKNLYLSICGYNWGPTSIRRKIVKRYNTPSMTPEQLYQLLSQRTPEETRNYLRRVNKRLGIYRPLFDGG